MKRYAGSWEAYIKPFLKAERRKPLARILRECLAYKRAYNLRPKDYFFLALYMDYIDADVTRYVPNAFIYHFNIMMNGELRPRLVEDKSLTSATLRAHQVASVEEFLAFDPDRGFHTPEGASCSIAQAARAIEEVGGRAFAKPLSANMGRGARLVSAGSDDLREISEGDQQMIFQPVVEQHRSLAALNPSSVNTIRINTLRTGDSVESHVATMRIGRLGRIVDNAAAGGLCVKVDMESGRLGRYARMKPPISTRQFEHHPDTGVAFGSIVVPFWAEVKELVRRGARAMAPLRSLGWDIAVTPNGPMVIETNAAWAPEVFQLCEPLGNTALAAHIMAERGRPAPAGAHPA